MPLLRRSGSAPEKARSSCRKRGQWALETQRIRTLVIGSPWRMAREARKAMIKLVHELSR
jgi:hypothetical protein